MIVHYPLVMLTKIKMTMELQTGPKYILQLKPFSFSLAIRIFYS